VTVGRLDSQSGGDWRRVIVGDRGCSANGKGKSKGSEKSLNRSAEAQRAHNLLEDEVEREMKT
jgi:hypothetical protein